jgi:hypothetical protein
MILSNLSTDKSGQDFFTKKCTNCERKGRRQTERNITRKLTIYTTTFAVYHSRAGQ